MQLMLAFLQLVALLEIATGDPPRLPAPNENLNIYALPVGQGDCTVIQCPQNTGGVSIIDIGSSSDQNDFMNKASVVEYLSGQRIDAVILTHSDKDHVNYLNAVLAPLEETDYPTVYHSCEWSKYEEYFTKEVNDKLKKRQRIDKCCGRNDCLQKVQILSICNGQAPVTLNILGSEQDNCCGSNPNGDSVVTLITYGNIPTLLVVGDFEGGTKFISDFIKCTGGSGDESELRSQLYRLSHHGADNGEANTVPFLEAVGTPDYVFSSSGFHGHYKHPKCRLKDYYTGKTKEVENHAYTCYDKDAGIWNINPTTAGIFVTSTAENEHVFHNYIIQFAVDGSGNIAPSLTEV